MQICVNELVEGDLVDITLIKVALCVPCNNLFFY